MANAAAAMAEYVACKIIFWGVKAMMHTYRLLTSKLPAAAPRSVGAAATLMRDKYNWTGDWYDLLDAPWEVEYRTWRPSLAGDLEGDCLELGVGTGRNLAYYPPTANVVGIDISEVCEISLSRAARLLSLSPPLSSHLPSRPAR